MKIILNDNVVSVEKEALLEGVYLRHVLPVLVREFLTQSNYSVENLKAHLYRESTLRWELNCAIVDGLKNPVHSELVEELIRAIINRTKINDRAEILKEEFYSLVEKAVISSKNSEEARKIEKLIYELTENILVLAGDTIKNYSSLKVCKLKKVIINTLVVNMQLFLQLNPDGRIVI